MEQEYFVLYKRDRNGEKMKRCKGRMMYDKLDEFASKDRAYEFGLSHLQGPPIVAKAVKSPSDYKAQASYVVAAYFPSKYWHECYDGSSDPVPTHEVMRCSEQELEAVVEKIAGEDPEKIYLGIEEKLVPSPLDWVNSVNQK